MAEAIQPTLGSMAWWEIDNFILYKV